MNGKDYQNGTLVGANDYQRPDHRIFWVYIFMWRLTGGTFWLGALFNSLHEAMNSNYKYELIVNGPRKMQQMVTVECTWAWLFAVECIIDGRRSRWITDGSCHFRWSITGDWRWLMVDWTLKTEVNFNLMKVVVNCRYWLSIADIHGQLQISMVNCRYLSSIAVVHGQWQIFMVNCRHLWSIAGIHGQ